MPFEITMPQLSDTMTEGTLIKWLKKEGDKVKAGEIVAEVETDKANMEMECFESGTLASVVVAEGGKVPVGATIAVLATSKENAADVKKQYAASGGAPKSAPAPSATATLEQASRSEIHEPENVGHPAASASTGTNGERAAAPAPDPARPEQSNGDRLKASPLARKIAADRGIDLNGITGSGPGGRIVQADLATASAKPAAAVASAPSAPLPSRVLSGQKEVIPLTKMRSAIAAQLLKSKQSIPHFYETIDIDVEELGKLREKINKTLEKDKIRLSIGDFVAKAVASALLQHPNLNSTFNGTEITRYGDVNLGMAVALPEGLIVPVLRGINQMGLKEIRQRSADIVEKARTGKLKQDERTGGTFTVSNLGTFGIREFSAIVNPPEVGILAIAAAEKRAVVRDGQIVARTILTVTLSADHRVVDGADAAKFLQTLKQLLEEPAMMLV